MINYNEIIKKTYTITVDSFSYYWKYKEFLYYEQCMKYYSMNNIKLN